jgi:hypothetical protein
MSDKLHPVAVSGASMNCRHGHAERAEAHGQYTVECFGKDGKLKWKEVIDNVVCTIGKNLMLDTALEGSTYTVVGPYMGLISSVSWSAVNATDTMASHAGWTEAGSTNAPTFAARIIAAWSAASAGAKALSSSLSFTMTGNGTLEGCFIVYGTGAVATLMSTAGTLLSAGVFSGGARAVLSGDTVNVSYSLSL